MESAAGHQEMAESSRDDAMAVAATEVHIVGDDRRLIGMYLESAIDGHDECCHGEEQRRNDRR